MINVLPKKKKKNLIMNGIMGIERQSEKIIIVIIMVCLLKSSFTS